MAFARAGLQRLCLSAVVVFSLGCSEETAPTAPSVPTAPVASSTVPTASANPWPTLPQTPPALLALPAAAVPVAPQANATALTDEQVRERLEGTWVQRDEPTYDANGSSTHECVLVLNRNGSGTETCTQRTTPNPGVRNCAPAGQTEMVRATGSPYTVTVTNGVLLFTPGRGRVVQNTTCERIENPNHIPVRGRWTSDTELILHALTPSGTEQAYAYRYVREGSPPVQNNAAEPELD